MTPLLDALVSFGKLYHNSIDIETTLQGIPFEGSQEYSEIFTLNNLGLDDAFSRVTERAGFSSKLIQGIKLKRIPKVIFPVILLLKENKVCILTELSGEYSKVIMPEISGDKAYWVKSQDLKKEFTGSLFLLKPLIRTESNKREKRDWFWSSLNYSKGLYLDIFLASFLLNLFMLATPLFTMNVYDRVVPNSAFDTLWVFVIAIVVVYLFDTLMKVLRTYTLEVVAKKSDVLISSRIFEHVLNIKLSHGFSSVGAFASNLKEFDTIRSFFTASSMATVIDLPFLIIFLVVIFIIGGNIVAVPLVASALILFYSFIIKRPLQKSINNLSLSSAYKNALLIESLSTLETIKSFSLQSQMQWKWEESVGKIAKDEITSRLLTGSITTFTNFVIQIANVTVLILGVYAISEQSLTMGGLIALVMLTSRSLAPLNQFASLISNYEQSKRAYYHLNTIMKLPTDSELHQDDVERKKILGQIEFKEVKFKYPESKNYILDGISFKIDAGESVAIIGTNGSGKTTILKLIMGLYEPESGSILIDGIDIRQFNPHSLRKSMAYLPQEIVLFKGTLQENIRNSVDKLSDKALILSSKLSGVETFVAKNSMGYNMPIKERGEGVSLGEKQSIGLARLFAKSRASMVLMDEPTNGMDSNSELWVLKSLQGFITTRTMLMVSHKNNLLKLSKRLILLENGKILLDGSYKDVIEQLSLKGKV
jgi:ATP-binding cassette subfamily C protein LapB